MSSTAPGSAHGGYLPGTSAYRRVVIALFAAGLATFALLYSTQPLLPELATEFSLGAGQAALSVSLATLGLGIALLVVGPLTDALGRTPVMHGSLALAAVVGLATAAAPNWPLLLAARTLQGASLAGLSAVALAYLKEEIAPSAHARASGLYIGGTALGGMSGRLVAGWVGELAGWRWAIAVIGLVALVCTIAVRLMLPASVNFRPRVNRLGDVVAGTVRVVRDPGLLGIYAIALLGMGAFVGIYNAIGFRLAAAPYSLNLGQASLIFLAYALGSFSSAIAGRLADRFTRRSVVVVMLMVMLAGVALTPAAPLWLVALAIGVLTIGWFGAHGVASGWVAARAAAIGAGAGQASSLYLFAYYLGSSIVGTAAAQLWGSAGWGAVATVLGALVAVALLVALLLAGALRSGRLIGVEPLRRDESP